jgi:hypothetical protein
MVNLRRFAASSLLALSTCLAVGCAPAEENSAPVGADEQDLTQLSDAALQGKLKGILADVTFMSESDYPYVVLEGEAVTEKRLSTKLVRQKLRAAVKAASSAQRDIADKACRSRRVDVSKAIAEGEAAQVPADKNAEDYSTSRHDKQVMIALKTMRSQLRGVVGFTFGENESGDQDDKGTVHFVYVGISKTSGKLIAIMTEAVFT